MAATDRRGYEVRHTWDEQWLRILDVDAALRARSYAEYPAAFTVAVTDELLPANTGVWEISSAGAKRTSIDAADADLATDIGGISAAYLGGPKWTFLADASRDRGPQSPPRSPQPTPCSRSRGRRTAAAGSDAAGRRCRTSASETRRFGSMGMGLICTDTVADGIADRVDEIGGVDVIPIVGDRRRSTRRLSDEPTSRSSRPTRFRSGPCT